MSRARGLAAAGIRSITKGDNTMFARSLIAATLLALAGAAGAQSYPTKPIRIIVPFTPGSGTDVIARAIGDKLSTSLGQPVVVENKPGAGGTIGAAQVAKAEPDGYTLLVHSSGHAVSPVIYPNLTYNAAQDFAGVALLATLPNVLVTSPTAGYAKVTDLVAKAKSAPGKMNYASAGLGSATHMNAAKFTMAAGVDIAHVPYKGTPEAITDVTAGRVDMFFAPLVSSLALIKDGRLKALAVGTPSRSALLPEVPTTVEAGVPGSDYTFWVGLLAPAKTPRALIDRLHAEVQKAIAQPDLKERYVSLGAEPGSFAPAQMDSFLKDEFESAGRIAKAAGLKAN
jgi:tripartite-type tricarboxylate transporter receptor subunit TctC